MTIKVKVKARGPLVIELGGEPLELTGPDGQVRKVEGAPRLLLCRCGASESKPYCDGAHHRVGFECERQSEPSE